MRKMLSVLLVMTLITILFTACGSNNNSKGTTNNTEPTGTVNTEVVEPAKEIAFWHSLSGPIGEELNNLVNRYNQSQDQIKVIASFQGNYTEANGSLQQAIAAKIEPAIAMVESNYYYTYEATNQFEDLTPYMERDGVNPDDFIQGLMPANLTTDSGIFAVPFNRSSAVLYYNKEMFREVGLDPEQPPKTWDELFEYAKKLSIPDERWGFTTYTEVFPLTAFIAQAGGKLINDNGTDIGFKDDGSGVEALNVWLTMKKDNSMKINAATAFGMTNQDFIQQKVGMAMGSTGDLSNYMNNAEFEFGVAFLPSYKKASTPTGGAYLGVPKNATPAEKEAAWQFIKFATSVEQIYEFSIATGYLPTRHSAVEYEPFKKLWEENPQYKVAYDQLQFAEDSTLNPKWAELQNEMWATMQAVILDESITPEQGVEEMSKATQRILK